MRLATLREGGRDGTLVVVARDGMRGALASTVAPSLQKALDDWDHAGPALEELAMRLEAGALPSFSLEPAALASPLPRAYEWVDGAAYSSQVARSRRPRTLPPTGDLRREPLVHQGGSSRFLAPRDPLWLLDPAHGLDFEGEVGVILGDVPCAATEREAERCIRLLVLINDTTLRNLVPDELAKGFGFFQAKPAVSLSPFAVTPDELRGAWEDGRLHLRLRTALNGLPMGHVHAGREMQFSFPQLIAFIAHTRAFSAGTLLGSGAVSSSDPAEGASCLAERRLREIMETGRCTTPFLRIGDRVRISMPDAEGWDVFGAIEHEVKAFSRAQTNPRANSAD